MKKIFGFILLGLGLVTLIRGIGVGLFEDIYTAIGALIGIGLICFLPAYFLLRTRTHFEDTN